MPSSATMRRVASVTVAKVPTGIQSLSVGVFIVSCHMVNVCHWPGALSKPRNRADAYAVALREGARRLAFGEALPRLLDLVRGEFWLTPHLDALRAGNLSAFVGALDDPQAFVLGHCRHHRHETPPHRGGEVDIAAVENLDRGSGVDHRFDDLQTVPHRARGAIPFGNHKLVAAVEVIEGAGELRASGHALA